MAEGNSGIFMPDGTFRPFSAESLSTELATRQNAGLALGDAGLWLDLLPDPDPILRKRGDDAAILEQLTADDQVTTAILSRKNRVLNAPQYAYRSGAPDGAEPMPEAELVYARLIEDLERVNMRTIISGILDAPFYGMTPLELIWKPAEGWWHIVDIVARPYHWFAFDMQNAPVFRGALGWAAAEPQPLPPGKFVLISHHATYDNPYGLRLLSRCLWPVAFKKGGLSFYAKFVERHGLPWVIGKAPAKATREEKQVMARDLARMVQDCVAALPYGSDVQLLASGGTQDVLHERFLSRQDKAISKLLMGQTLTVEMEGRNNSQAAATTHEDVAEGLADSDKAMVCDAMNEIGWLYTRVNAGPKVFAPVFSFEEPEDLISRADLDAKLCGMGVQFTKEHFKDNYNLKESEFELRQNTPHGQTQTGRTEPDRPASFAALPGKETTGDKAPDNGAPLVERAQGTFDKAFAKLLPEAVRANEVFVKKIENAIFKAESFDAMQLALADLLAPSMDAGPLEELLTRSMIAAAGFGASAVQGEAAEE